MKKFLCLLALVSGLLAGCTGDAVQPLTPTVPPVPVSFIDPTASLDTPVELGDEVFIGPFAQLRGQVSIGDESNIQDNVVVTGPTALGDHTILAHGCSVVGPAQIGAVGGLPCFVSFNALVDGAIVEPDAMVGSLARLGPGVTLHSGMRVLAGKNVTTQAEADNISLGKVVPVTDADRAFMAGVLEVNEALAVGYSQLQASSPSAVRGIGPAPPNMIGLVQGTPRLAGTETLEPAFRNRIIGAAELEDALAQLDFSMGSRDSIRADEGGPFHLGHLGVMGDEVTFHALEHTEIAVGQNFRIGAHSLVHGGADDGNSPTELTRIGNNVTVGSGAIVFRSTVGDDCLIGDGALVDGCQLAPGTSVAPKTVLVKNQNLGTVEW
jgi:carbonic anhydrase/acetyltransferase-like protein (isoleucine patch superfamily)